MIWAGSPFAQRIEFSTGLPTGAVSYQLLDNDGTPLIDTSFTPDAGAISWLLVIGGTHNSCSKPLFETRTLVWSYTNADGLVSDRATYQVQKPIPFAASADGVRLKLGVEKHELTDDQVDLLSAYSALIDLMPNGALVVHETAGDRGAILCIHAIEALAALAVLPALQLKLAQRESSGTNEFHRFQKPEWDRIQSDLLLHVDRARDALDPSYDPTTPVLAWTTAPRTVDAVTGA